MMNETEAQHFSSGEFVRNASKILNISDIDVDSDVLYDVPVQITVLLSIFYGSISLLAVIGNSLVIWIVATTRQMQTVTNLFIANLALADVVIGMFVIPFQFQAALLQRWNLPEFMCAFCPFVQTVSVNVSVFTLTAIAVDRHRAIINPLRARPPTYISKIIIGTIWVISVSFSIPIAIAHRVGIEHSYKILPDQTVEEIAYPFCNTGNLDAYKFQQYRYYLVFFQYFIPFGVISFVYIQMAIRLWGSKTPGNAQNARDITLLRNKKRVIKMLIIVVLLFGLCWFPLQLYNILHVTWDDVNAFKYINIIWFCCDWLAMSNSCYNPFIYGIYNEKFQREFRRRFPFIRLGSGDANDKNVSMYTRASSIRSTYTASATKTKLCIPNHASGRNTAQLNALHTNGAGACTIESWTLKTSLLSNQASVETNEQTIKCQDAECACILKSLQENEQHSSYSMKYTQQCSCNREKTQKFEKIFDENLC